MVNAIEAFEAKHITGAENIPDFRPGDSVDVSVKITEGNNTRLQSFAGVVIARQGIRRARDLRRAQGELRRGRGASLPAALPGDRLD